MRILAKMFILPLAILVSPALASEEVDLELFLAVDVSRSMAPAELEIQRRGYAEALRSDAVVHAIEAGLIGTIALSYVEWAGAFSQREVVPWTTISNRAEANAVADVIAEHRDLSMRRTSISGALVLAAESMEANDYHGLRRVVDVSGDGPNNDGRPVTRARDRLVEMGITINGLPLMTRDGLGGRWYLEDLDDYYRACVIGGPGAFVIPVLDWSEFASAVRRKLVLEIAGTPLTPDAPVIWPASAHTLPQDSYDCLIGEKVWEEYMRTWDGP